MAILELEDGRKIKVNKSLKVEECGGVTVDDVYYPPKEPTLVARITLTPDNELEYFTENSNSDLIIEIYDNDPIEIVREVTGRAGYGKDMQGEYRVAMLKHMSNPWLEASIDFDERLAYLYESELRYRKENKIHIDDSDASYFSSWSEASGDVNDNLIKNWIKSKKAKLAS